MAIDQIVQYSELPDAAWAKLEQAANDPTQMLRLMAVATVTSDGKPSNRMLVLRGADHQTGMVWFHTDKRSPKMSHLSRVPYVSAMAMTNASAFKSASTAS